MKTIPDQFSGRLATIVYQTTRFNRSRVKLKHSVQIRNSSKIQITSKSSIFAVMSLCSPF